MGFLVVEQKQIPEDAIYIRTKFPEWNEQDQAYMVDFNGRVKKKSTKNYQLMVKILFIKNEFLKKK